MSGTLDRVVRAVPAGGFPSRREHERRWAELARAIAAKREERTADPAGIRPPSAVGQLIVLGSGIEAVGFTSSDEILLREADHVFFCVADPATTVWLKALRPDAYDLYVLYGEEKQRYVTYVEMTEAMLHYVREGQTVVAVYYGHPGVFVLSTHRAIQIARREGHRAVMRAAVSALDTLCADLGIDPSQPGLQTFEATDMLIRRRRLDPAVHVVLWQVGLIGELGFRRLGFLNHGFGLLLDYLEAVYGPDQPVINYVGSRYPGVEPVIDRHTISSLREPAVQATVTGISTFYVQPKDVALVDPDVLAELGLIKPGQTIVTPTSPLRVIDQYGPRELKAFDDLAGFQVPESYHWQEDTPAARFVLALREDPALQARYVADPAGTLAAWPDPELEPADRELLAKREAGAVQIAAKGLRIDLDGQADRLLARVLTRKPAARELLQAVRRAAPGEGMQALAAWSAEHGFAVDWDRMPYELDRFQRRYLWPWTGLYLCRDREQSILLVAGRRRSGGNRVFLDGRQLEGARYDSGVVRWRAQDGNPTSGNLQTDMSTGGRRLVGSIWPAGEAIASEHRVAAWAHPLGQVDASTAADAELAGRYTVRVAGAEGLRIARFTLEAGALSISGETPSSVEHDGSTWSWRGGPSGTEEGEVTAVLDPITGQPMLFGSTRSVLDAPASALSGMVPLEPGRLASLEASPRLDLPPWAWTHVLGVAAAASNSGGLFLWHSWDAAVLCLRMVRAAIREART